MRASVTVRLLGALQVATGHDVVPVTGAIQSLVLVHLALHDGRIMPVERLIDRVWVGEPPPTAASALRTHITRLRHILGPDAIVHRANAYALADHVDTDVRQFTGLVEAGLGAHQPADRVTLLDQALDLWRGQPAEGLDPYGLAGRFEHLDSLHRRARIERAAALMATGQPGVGTDALFLLAAEFPFDERVAGLLARSLYADGRASDALGVLHQFRRRIADELGLDPSQDLEQVELALLRHDRGELVSGPAAQPLPPSLMTHATGQFAGREDALRRLTEAWAGLAPAAPGRTVLVVGPAGIGKTRLVAEFVRTIAEQGAVLHGWADEMPNQALAPIRAAGVVVPLVDDLWSTVDAVSAELERRAGPNRLVVFLDDLHNADSASLVVLGRVARRRHANVMLVLAGRPDPEAGWGWFRGSDALVADPTTEVIRLEPLPDAAAAALVATLDVRGALDDDQREAIVALAAGQPFALRTMVETRGAAPDGAASIVELLGRTFSSLEHPVRQVIEYAAVAGPTFDVGEISVAAGATIEHVLARLDTAVGVGIVQPIPGQGATFRFAHDLWRDAVIGGLSPAHRRRCHARLAEALQAGEMPSIVRIAAHTREAVPLVPAVAAAELTEAEARVHLAEGAFDEAAERFEQARRLGEADLPPDRIIDLMVGSATALDRSGQHSSAMEGFVQAAALARRRRCWPGLIRVALASTNHGPVLNGDPRVPALLDEALAVATEPADLVQLLSHRGRCRPAGRRHSRAELEMIEEAEVLAKQVDTPEAWTSVLRARATVFEGEPAGSEVEDLAERLCDAAGTDPKRLAAGLVQRIAVAMERGRVDGAASDLARLAALNALDPVPRHLWLHGVFAAGLRQLRGDLAGAGADAAAALQVAERYEIVDGPAAFAAHTWVTTLLQGNVASLAASVRDFVAEYPGTVAWRAALATSLAWGKAAGEARTELERCVEVLSRRDLDILWPIGLVAAAEAALALGARWAAEPMIELSKPYAGLWPQVGLGGTTLGPIDRVRAGLAALVGDPEASSLYDAAEGACLAVDAPVWLAWTRAERALLLGGELPVGGEVSLPLRPSRGPRLPRVRPRRTDPGS
jgi:DNA-binding SARP family transcriptional activator